LKLLFFAPFSGVWEHAELEARLAGALQQAGHDVTYVTCGGALRRHCVVMAGMHLRADADPATRESACRKCRARADAVRREFRLTGPTIDDLVDAAELRRIGDTVDHGEARALVDSIWHGIPAGRRALFPFLVYKKKDDLELDDGQWREYRDQLHQAMVAISAARAALADDRPDHVITYSATYSVVSTFLQVARDAGVGDYFTEASGNLAHRGRRAILGRHGIIPWFEALRALWPQVEGEPADAAQLEEAGDHAVNLFGAVSPFSYSTSAGSGADAVRAAVHAPPGSKLLLATLSSYDEWFAAEEAGLATARPSAFGSQLDWIDWLVARAAKHQEWHLVIRVHPREFPNRRERSGLLSSHARKLQARLAQLPGNCFVNWPSQQLSLYDLAKAADVVLNAWSSAGKEMALLGLPVVEWAPDVLLYPPDPRYCADTPEGYAACIDRALGDGWQAGNIARMFRWCALEYGAASFVMRDGASRGPAGAPLLLRAARRLARARVDAWAARRDPLPAGAVRQVEDTLQGGKLLLVAPSRGDAASESRMLAVQVRRMAGALHPNPDANDGLRGRLLAAADGFEAGRVEGGVSTGAAA
jgi:hypothetical protein